MHRNPNFSNSRCAKPIPEQEQEAGPEDDVTGSGPKLASRDEGCEISDGKIAGLLDKAILRAYQASEDDLESLRADVNQIVRRKNLPPPQKQWSAYDPKTQKKP